MLPVSLWGVTAVSGTVSLEFWPAERHNVPVTVEIRQGNVTVQTTTVNLASDGKYTVPLLQPLDYGTYNVTIKASHWLRALGQNVTIPGGRFDCELKNGDATNDNVVDVLDLNYVLLRFATTDPTADLDGSGVVDLPDISIVLLNFTMQGASAANNQALAPKLDGLSGNGRNLLFIDLGSSSNPYAPYRVYRKAGGGNYSLVGETPMRLFLDTSATNGTTYTYKACVLNASGENGPESDELVLTPTAQNPTCTATVTSETGTSQASGAVWANLSAFSSGVDSMALCLDGEYVDFSGRAQPSLSYDSECGRNGLRAAVVVVWDNEERYGFSDITPMTFDNEFSVATLSAPEINPDNLETVLFACKLKSPQNFRVDIVVDATLNIVKTWTSPSPSAAVTYEWDGTDMYGTGVEDDTYRFVVTLIDKPGQPKTKPKRLEVSRVGLGQARAVAVNAVHHADDDALTGYRRVQAVREACKRVALPLKVFNPGKAYWTDPHPDNGVYGIRTWLMSGGSNKPRLLYIYAHGHHYVHGEDGPRPQGTTVGFTARLQDPTEVKPKAFLAYVNKLELDSMQIPEKKFRLVWVDSCGTGRRLADRYPNLKHPDSWKAILPNGANDLGAGFGIRTPESYDDPVCYYMGYYGYAEYAHGYPDMVSLFFSRFSEGSGTPRVTYYTVGQVMGWLAGRSEVTSEFHGSPFIDVDEDGYEWLFNAPAFYNIRVFTDSWTGLGPDYNGLRMSDMRQ